MTAVTLTPGVSAFGAAFDEVSVTKLSSVAGARAEGVALAPDVAEELVPGPHRHHDGAGERDLADVEEHLADRGELVEGTVMSVAVRQREREVAVRMAVGADRPTIVRLFLTQGAAVLGAGLLFGMAGAMALGRVLQAQLFGVHSADPVVLAIATCAFGVCGLLAVSIPAFAAASTDPAAALKE